MNICQGVREIDKNMGENELKELMSLWPELVDLNDRLMALLSGGSAVLGPEIRELIGARAAQLTGSEYEWETFKALLIEQGWSEEKVLHILQDIDSKHLNNRDRAVLRFADKMIRIPEAMTSEDADALRREGLSDREILEAASLAAFYNSQSMIANALGVVQA